MLLDSLQVDETARGRWCITYPDGSRFDADTYARAQDAKRAITMLRKHTSHGNSNIH